MKMRTINKFISNIDNHNLICENDNIIAAISGGADSVFLFYQLLNLKQMLKFNLIVCHLNHLTRKESYRDEKFVHDLCKNHSIRFISRRQSMNDYAKKHKITKEEAGRVLRFKLFNDIGSTFDNYKIALAHNLDDQAETVLMRIIRGTGVDGLSAMHIKDGRIIRPILNIRKKDIIAYLKEDDISYVEDKTNFQPIYTRNKIRLEILPILRKINPNVEDAIYRLAQNADSDLIILEEYLEGIYNNILIEQNLEYIIISKAKFDRLKDAVKNRILRKIISLLLNNTKNFNSKHIQEFKKISTLKTSKRISIGKIEAAVEYDTYKFETKSNVKKTDFLYDINVEIVDWKKEKKQKNAFYFDYDKINKISIRKRINGDKMIPIGMKNSKKIKDIFIDMKIPADKRDRYPIVLNDDEIILICPIKRSNLYKVSEKTNQVLKIQYVRRV